MKDLFDIGKKVIVVTGATGVLAGATARYLASCGARVAFLGRNEGKLEEALGRVPEAGELEKAVYYKDSVIPIMDALRAAADEIEKFVGEKYWPYPTYGELLYSV